MYSREGALLKFNNDHYLAMALGKFDGTIGSVMSAMLIDCRSELNLMSLDLQEACNLPMDPSMVKWTLCGINGDPVALVGICQNVLVEIGGVRFDHHFFVTREHMGKKDVILGQPWLYHVAASIKYDPRHGMLIQCWHQAARTS